MERQTLALQCIDIKHSTQNYVPVIFEENLQTQCKLKGLELGRQSNKECNGGVLMNLIPSFLV